MAEVKEPFCIGQANLLYKAEKPSLRPSVRPHFFGRVDLSRRCADRRQTCSKRSAGLLG